MERVAVVNPKTPPIPKTFYYIDLESVEAGILVKDNVASSDEAPSRAQRVLQPNDILYQTVRPYQKNNYFFESEREIPTVASTGYAQVRTAENAHFFYELFHTPRFVMNVLLRCTGTSYPAINGSDLNDIKVAYPYHDEQQKIATFMQLLEKRIDAQRRLVESLKSYKRGVFNHIYLKEIHGSREVSLGSVTTCHDSKRIPVNAQTRSGREGVYPYYGANGIQGYINDYIFDGDYILLAEDGGHFDEFSTRPIAQFISGKSWVNNHAHILEATGCVPKYLFYILEHMDIRSYINGTSRAKLNQEDMLTIRIPLPPADIQKRFTIALEGIDKQIDTKQRSLAVIEKLKNGLLSSLFI